MTFPLGTLYHGTKCAVEGLSEALHYEMASIGVKVKIVEPGIIATDYAGRSFDFANDESMVEYQGVVQNLMEGFAKSAFEPSPPSVVADVIWTAVRDRTLRRRIAAFSIT